MDSADAALPDWLELSDDTVEDVTEDSAEVALGALPSWLTELAPEVRGGGADIAPAADRILMPDDGEEAERLLRTKRVVHTGRSGVRRRAGLALRRADLAQTASTTHSQGIRVSRSIRSGDQRHS